MKRTTRKKEKSAWEKIRPHVLPIYQTSVYDYPDLQSLDDYYNGLVPEGYIYSRNGLPNSEELGRQVAILEGSEGGVVCSSGMAAIVTLLLANLKQGEKVVASSDVYGGTTVLFDEELPRLGIQTEFVDALDLAQVKNTLAKNRPRLVLLETISNPTMRVSDIEQIAELAHSSNAVLAVDNTFATPFVCRPADMGADIVMHSGTKFLGGHSDLTIGVLCGKGKILGRMRQLTTRLGTIAGPFDSWLASRSVSTWKLRVDACSSNAMKLAKYLESRVDKIIRVYYPGLPSSPSHKTASRIFVSGSYGGMLSFDLKGGLKSAEKFVRALSHVTLTPSLGGVRTTISHPGKTSHRHVSEETRRKTGITDSMIRVSLGVEDYEEIKKDFEKALAAA